jgi:hypothetical protein
MFIFLSPLGQTKHCVEKKFKFKDTNEKIYSLSHTLSTNC